jgi:hypothetical protein
MAAEFRWYTRNGRPQGDQGIDGKIEKKECDLLLLTLTYSPFMIIFELNLEVEWIELPFLILQALSPNLGPEIGYPD